MPTHDAHQRQKRKNWFLFAVLSSLVGVFYYVAILKISGQ